MQTSNPPFNLLKPETNSAIEKIMEFRNKRSIPVCFTLDAGPNIHLLYPLEIKSEITKFIQDELKQYCTEEKWIDDRLGSGPEILF